MYILSSFILLKRIYIYWIGQPAELKLSETIVHLAAHLFVSTSTTTQVMLMLLYSLAISHNLNSSELIGFKYFGNCAKDFHIILAWSVWEMGSFILQIYKTFFFLFAYAGRNLNIFHIVYIYRASPPNINKCYHQNAGTI